MKQKTLHIRVRDKHARLLNKMARDVNYCWNFCNDLSYRSIRQHGRWLSGYDMQKYMAGTSKLPEIAINSSTIDAVAVEYATRRKQFKKAQLRWRSSYGSRKSLGWVPVKATAIKAQNDGVSVKYAGHIFQFLDKSYNLIDFKKLRAGNFSQDARGNWYFNVCVDYEPKTSSGKRAIGINLGIAETIVCSNGLKFNSKRFSENAKKLAEIQRHAKDKSNTQKGSTLSKGKRKQIQNIHAKIKNKRNDDLHKITTHLVNNYAAIFVGNVDAKKMAEINTDWGVKMGKYSLDSGWGMFKEMLKYKCDHAGILYEEVDESYTTQICSSCWSKPSSSPKGKDGLRIREWTCSECGAAHDRNINSAKVILAVGLDRLAGGSEPKNESFGAAQKLIKNQQVTHCG